MLPSWVKEKEADYGGGSERKCVQLSGATHKVTYTSYIFDCLNIIFLSFRTDRFCQIVLNVLLLAILSASF